jgi:hypothetical protein
MRSLSLPVLYLLTALLLLLFKLESTRLSDAIIRTFLELPNLGLR